MGLSSRLRSVLGLAAAAALLAAGPLAAQTGTISGRVTDASTQRALVGAQVTAGGRSVVTNAEGSYTITLAPGSHTVRASTLGYSAGSRTVTVAAGQTTTANFALATSAIDLEQLVVTGTPGATERRELGNAVTSVNAAEITAKAPVSTVTQLLQARAPGLTIMQPSGSVGTAASFRIRGTGSVSGGVQPIFYIDGVRMAGSGQTGFGVGGQSASNLDAINPDDIESIEVIKGPAAATLYGAEAASGVIQIITKKGRTGRQSLQWTSKVEAGANDWTIDMLTNYNLCTAADIAARYRRPGGALTDSLPTFPGCQGVAPNTVITDRPLEDVLESGGVLNLNAGVRGGGERFSFYLSGDRDTEEGVFVNNEFNRTSGRANFFVTPSDYIDVSTNVQYTSTETIFPLNDNASNGWLRNAYRGTPGRFVQNSSFAEGWAGLGPEQMSIYDNSRQADRFILGVTTNYQPFKWFRNRLTAGLDAQNYQNVVQYPIDVTGRAPYGGTAATGARYVYQPEIRFWTLDYAGTISNNLNSELTSNLSFGMQLNARSTTSWELACEGLLSDQLTDCDQAKTRQVFEGYSEQNSLGYFIQEQLGWRDRLHVTGALRVDDNSAFGEDFSLVAYPKLSLAWVLSEEPFFNVAMVDNLKLRAAWGQAGNSPDPFSADRTFQSSTVTGLDNTPIQGIRAWAWGNPNLKAETGSELELGFDASLFEGRMGAEVTFYDKKTYDALIPIPVKPSSGFARTILDNIGEISNRGLEVSLFGTPLQRSNLVWETQLGFSTNRNEFVKFGGGRTEPILQGYGGGVQRIQEGYPMGGYFVPAPLRNPDGTYQLDAQGRAVLSTDTAFIGSSVPTREASLANTVTLFGNLRLYGFVDYKGGHYLFNFTEYTRDRDGNTQVRNDPNVDANYLAMLLTPNNNYPYVDPADHIKLREISATYTFPRRLTQRFGTDNMSFSLSGRNLAILWSKYPGIDPEVNIEGNATFTRGDYMSVPMIRRLVATLSVSF